MPIYLYRNLTTGETFEVEQRMTEPALSVHPETGDPVKRLIQPVGIAFKGSGFYVTDSRSSNGASKPAGDKGSEPKPAAADGGEAKASSDASPPSTSSEGASAPKSDAKSDSKSTSSSDAGGGSSSKGGAPAGGSSSS